jgi:3-phosphoshikimate 1-carboxyvinyltransferase
MTLSDSIEIEVSGPASGTVRPPGSKSITNRALVCAALAEGQSTLRGVLDSEDTRVMIDSLGRLGLQVEHDRQLATVQIAGCAGRPAVAEADLYIANSGTTVRFLTALATLSHGRIRLDGTQRMRERPIGDLIEALGQLGAHVQSEQGTGCPPVIVRGKGLAGGTARVAGNISSQFLSGLLMAAPCAGSHVELIVEGELVSKPYVDMTLAVMRSFGVTVDGENLQRFSIPAPQTYLATDYSVEPDASAASYFFAAAAVTGGQVTVEGLSRSSLQGDVAFCDCLQSMGCEVRWESDRITVVGRPLRGIEVDMNAISDTVQTLAAVAVFADGPTHVTGVGHIRHKETDRIGALATELRKLGALVEEEEDGLTITPAFLKPAEIDTYDDHRMAMSLALIGLKQPGVVICDPACTGKTYPEFFQDLKKVTTSG